MDHEPKEYPDLPDRLMALSNLAIGLGHAIQGLGESGQVCTAKELIDQLVYVAKRIGWLEKTSDPHWAPFDPQKHTTFKDRRNGAKSTTSDKTEAAR